MKLAATAGALVLQALAVLQHAADAAMMVEFNPDLVTYLTPRDSLLAVDGFMALDGNDTSVTDPGDGGDDIHLSFPEVPFDSSASIIGELKPGVVIPPSDKSGIPGSSSLLAAQSSKASAKPYPWTFLAETQPQNPPQNPSSDNTRACSIASSTSQNDRLKVLLLTSSCFNQLGLQVIQGWLSRVQEQDVRYFDGEAASKISFTWRTVDDGCNKPNGSPDYLNTNAQTPYDAVISITVYSIGATVVNSFVLDRQISIFVGLVYNDANIQTALVGYTQCQVTTSTSFLVDVNPFALSRAFHCRTLPGGIPTTYVDNSGNRRCFCSCPQGYEISGNRCVPTTTNGCYCAWQKQTNGYLFNVNPGEEVKYKSGSLCLINGLATKAVLPVPVAVDNYVDHNRDNFEDSVAQRSAQWPHIELQNRRSTVTVGSTTQNGDVGTTDSYTWKDFQTTSTAKIDTLRYTTVGRYEFQLKARDYGNAEATCPGCIAIVDNRRPTSPAASCPAAAQLTVASALSSANLALAQASIDGVGGAYKTARTNDPCGGSSYCDLDKFQSRTFSQSNYGADTQSLGGVSDFFLPVSVKTDLTARLSPSPLDSNACERSSITTSCKRCAKVGTKLREYWTNYNCGSTSAVSTCSGNDDASSTCEVEQCIEVNGPSIATAAADVKTAVQQTSLNVLKGLVQNNGRSDDQIRAAYTLSREVHIALECSAQLQNLLAGDDDVVISPAPEVCTYSSTISALIDKSVSVPTGANLFTQDELNGFVAWRYQVAGQSSWKSFDSTTPEIFSKTSTSITVQAWTQCGMVQTFTFTVKLHVNNIIQVCDHFDNMWYQSTTKANNNNLCMYPKSDFAELTFDYHPNIGLQSEEARLALTISSVSCKLDYGASAASGATIVDVSAPASLQIVKEFSIDGYDLPTTRAQTPVTVSCTFTYSRRPDDKKVVQRCDKSFTIVDCSPPLISRPCALDGKCDFNKCAKLNNGNADLYQACDGNRIYQTTAAGPAVISTTPLTCCQSCTSGYVPACTPIQVFPNGVTTASKYISRCEPIPQQGAAPVDIILEASDAEEMESANGVASTNTMTLLAASAMVALVALVAVRHRRATQAKRRSRRMPTTLSWVKFPRAYSILFSSLHISFRFSRLSKVRVARRVDVHSVQLWVSHCNPSPLIDFLHLTS